MKQYIVILLFLIGNFCFGQDYLLQNFTTGGSDQIYGKRKLVADNNGNIYAVGLYQNSFEIQNSVITGSGIYLAKFDNDLSLIWLKKVAEIMGADASGSMSGLKLTMALDSSDNVLISYSAWGGCNLQYDDSVHIQTNNVELIKLDSSGTRLWRIYVTGSERLGDKGLSVDNQNNILITGKDLNDDVFIAKYDETGSEMWFRTAGVSGVSKTDVGTAIATDTSNNVYAVGMLYSNGSADTAYFGSHQIVFPVSCYSPSYLAKYTSNGTFEWVRYVYSSNSAINPSYGSSTITSIECFENGNIVVGGFFTNSLLEFSDELSSVDKQGNTGFRSSFLARFDIVGNRLWAKTLHNTSDGGTHITDLSIDNEFSIYLLNEYWGTIVNEMGNTTTNGSSDLLIERYDENGNLISSMGMGGNSLDFGYDIVTAGNSVITHSTTGSQGGTPFYMNSDSLVFSGGYLNNMVILKLTENPTLEVQENGKEHNVLIFPNPNNGVFTVLVPEEISEICIYSTLGKLVYKTPIQSTELFNINIQNCPSGIYFLNVKSKLFNVTNMVIKN